MASGFLTTACASCRSPASDRRDAADLTEADARAALRAFVAVGEVEPWIAEQPWEAVPGGWRVRGRLHGWRFRLEPGAGGVRVIMFGIEDEPAAWIVPAR